MICQDVVLDRRNNGFRLQLPAVRNGKTYGDRAFSIGILKQAVMLYLILFISLDILSFVHCNASSGSCVNGAI